MASIYAGLEVSFRARYGKYAAYVVCFLFWSRKLWKSVHGEPILYHQRASCTGWQLTSSHASNASSDAKDIERKVSRFCTLVMR